MQSSAPDDGRKHRRKHVELTWNNKLIYIVHLVGYFHSCIRMYGFMNVKFIFEATTQRNVNEGNNDTELCGSYVCYQLFYETQPRETE